MMARSDGRTVALGDAPDSPQTPTEKSQNELSQLFVPCGEQCYREVCVFKKRTLETVFVFYVFSVFGRLEVADHLGSRRKPDGSPLWYMRLFQVEVQLRCNRFLGSMPISSRPVLSPRVPKGHVHSVGSIGGKTRPSHRSIDFALATGRSRDI